MGLNIIIVNHLGTKPVNGGNPPNDKSPMLNKIDIENEFIIIWGICEKVNVFHEFNIINIGEIIIE